MRWRGTGRRQRGAALLLFLALLLFGLLTRLFAPSSINEARAESQERTTRALAAAKAALIAYSVVYADNYGSSVGPGHLPCPDRDDDGSPDPPCSATGNLLLGRLPRSSGDSGRFQEFSSFGAQSDQRFWYALSKGFRNNPAGVVNSETAGQLTLDGGGDLVALLIAPGAPLAGQQRPGNDPADYLEGENADGDTDFASRAEGSNDILLPIGRDELMAAVEGRVVAAWRDLARRYRAACGLYPWPAPYGNPRTLLTLNSSPGTTEGLFPAHNALPTQWGAGCAAAVTVPVWLTQHRWHRLTYYALASTGAQAGGGCDAGVDCLRVDGLRAPNDDKIALVLLAGRELPGEDRAAFTGPDDYFEGQNGSPGDRLFETRRPSNAFNDALAVVQ